MRFGINECIRVNTLWAGDTVTIFSAVAIYCSQIGESHQRHEESLQLIKLVPQRPKDIALVQEKPA